MSNAFAAFALTSPATQAAAPFWIGHAFKKGEVPSNYYVATDLANSVVVPLRTWNDGSLKHAAIVGRAPLTANVNLQVNLLKTLTAPAAGTLLTADSIQAAAPTASVQLGSIGTVSLTPLLGSPVRTFVSTKEVVECHYKAQVGSDPTLYVLFHVRLYVDGRMRVRVIVGNGYLGVAKANKTYAPTVIIGGVTVFTAATYYHWPWARWDQVAWIGTNPQVTPIHDKGYLGRTKLVPNIWKNTDISANATYMASLGSYTPGANLGFTASMGNGGYQDGIGIVPRWDAIYLGAGAKVSFFDTVISHARAINSYPISYADPATCGPIKITDYPTWSIYGAGGGGSPGESAIAQNGTTSLDFEKSHHTSAGYLAYLITADYHFLDTCQQQARLVFLCEDINSGTGTNRIMQGQNRSRGWGYRSIGQAAALYPDSMAAQFGDISAWVAGMTAVNVGKYGSVTPNWIGYENFYQNRLYDSGSGTVLPAPNGQYCAATAPWEHHFTTMAYGALADGEPINEAAMANVRTLRDYLDGAPVWITGGTTVNDYNYGYAAKYDICIRTGGPHNADGGKIADLIPANPGQIYTDSWSDSPTTLVYNPGTATLEGLSAGHPSLADGYWGNLLPALASAVDHGKAGAAASWARIIGAPNFATTQAVAPYDQLAAMGIVPRSYSQQPMTFTAVGSNADPEPSTGAPSVTTPGPCTRVGRGFLVSGGTCVSTHHGLGIKASEIPTGFTLPPFLLNDIIAGGDANNEYAMELLTGPGGGTLVGPGEFSEFIFSGPNGIYGGNQVVKTNGVSSPTTYSFAIGTAATVTGVTITPGSATVAGGATQGFSASVAGAGGPSQAVTWSTTGAGAIDAFGTFTAAAAQLTPQTATVKATSTQDPSKFATVTIVIPGLIVSSVTGVSIVPVAVSLAGGATQQFNVTVSGVNNPSQGVTLAATGGNITQGGLYTAPAAANVDQIYNVTARSVQDGNFVGLATVVIPAVVAAPVAAQQIDPVVISAAPVLGPTGWTKQQLIEEAFSELALSGYTFNIGPDEMQGALRRLDLMMATWNAKGIRLGYALPQVADGSKLDQLAGIPDGALEATVLNLAIRIAGSFGKTVTQATAATARAAFDGLMMRAAMPGQQKSRRMLRGAGHKPFHFNRTPFTSEVADDVVTAMGDNPIDFD